MKNRRMQWLLIAVSVLVVANLVTRMGDGGGDSFEWPMDTATALDNPKTTRLLQRIETHPVLTFDARSTPEAHEYTGRNPFEFGVDRRLQEAQKQRQEEMRLQAEMETAVVEPDLEPQIEAPAQFEGTVLGVFQDTHSGHRRVALKHDFVVWVLGVGERIEEIYEVRAIDDERVVIRHLQREQDIEIEYSEKQPAGTW